MTPLVAAVLTVLLNISPAGSAQPATDLAGDVLSGSPESDTNPRHPEPRVALGDATDVDVQLGTDLVVTTTYRRLDATGYQRYSWSIRTPGERAAGLEDWWISYETRPGRDTGKLWIVDGHDHDRDCGTVVLDRAAGSATLTLTNACIGDVAWVRLGTGLYVIRGGTVYADDAQRGGLGLDWKLGPRVGTS
jgi:hypothetical protein